MNKPQIQSNPDKVALDSKKLKIPAGVEKNAFEFAQQYFSEIQNWQVFKVRPTVIFYLEGDGRPYLLRSSKIKPVYKKWFGSHGFVNQMAVYRAFSRNCLQNFRVPTVIRTGGRTLMLLEFINHAETGPFNDEKLKRKTAQSLLEFQEVRESSPLPAEHKVLRNFFNLRDGLRSKGVINFLKLSKHLTYSRILKGLKIYWLAGKLPHKIWIHGDFHPNNIVKDPSNQLFIIDFEYSRRYNNGLFMDAAQYAVDWENFAVDKDFLKFFNQEVLKSYPGKEKLIYRQLRAALLRRVSQVALNRRYTSGVKQAALQFILDKILNDKGFKNWFGQDQRNSTIA